MGGLMASAAGALSNGAVAGARVIRDRETGRARGFALVDMPDIGEAMLATNTGASCYCRVDWFNPAGLRTWGDGRTFVLGTTGYLEIRKYIDVAREPGGNLIFLVDQQGEHLIPCAGQVGFPFPGQLILDVLNRAENAMTQAHAFKAAELSMQAQRLADQRRNNLSNN